MRWIVVDGIDGSGKSTHAYWIKDLYERKGCKVLLRIHPSDGFLGKVARGGLERRGRAMRTVATVFFILDVLSSVRKLRRDRAEYDVVIFVRYLMATAYLPDRFVQTGYDFFAKVLPVPRRLLLIDVRPENALERILQREHRKEMFEDLDSLSRTRGKVLRLARPPWRVLDNNVAEEDARKALISVLEDWDAQRPED